MAHLTGTTPLHVAQSGHGPAVVLLHYFGASGRAWTQTAELLKDHFWIVMPDLRGFGESGALPAVYKVADAADDVLEMVCTLDLQRYVLVGHSMGGKIAMAVAARHPPGLVQLMLLAPSPPSPEPITPADRVQLLANQLDPTAAEKTIRTSCAQSLPDGIFRQVMIDRQRTTPEGWRWWLEQGSKEDISSSLPPISVPCQVLVGALDSTIPPSLVQSEVMPHLLAGDIRIVPGAGHLLPLEAPHMVAQAIKDFTFENQRNAQ